MKTTKEEKLTVLRIMQEKALDAITRAAFANNVSVHVDSCVDVEKIALSILISEMR